VNHIAISMETKASLEDGSCENHTILYPNPSQIYASEGVSCYPLTSRGN
jgi:hypothetical protein